MVSTRAAPRPTGAYGPREGVRPRPGAGQSNIPFFIIQGLLPHLTKAACADGTTSSISSPVAYGPDVQLRAHKHLASWHSS